MSFQRTARLAGLDHVHVQPVEALRALGHAFRKRRAGFDFFARIFERVLEPPGLGLAGQNPQAPQNRQTGVLQNRKLPRERRQIARLDAAEHEAALLLAPAVSAFLRAFFAVIFVTK